MGKLLYNVAGTLSKALTTLYIYTSNYGFPDIPEVSMNTDTLRLRDPISGVELLFYGDPVSLDPVEFHIISTKVFKEPDVMPPLRRGSRKIYFGSSASMENIDSMIGSSVSVFLPRKPLNLIKHAGGTIYYRRRFGKPDKKFSYDLLLMNDDMKGYVKCLSARFTSTPKPFRKIPLKKKFNEDFLVALDVHKNLFVVMRNMGKEAVVLESMKLDVEVPSIYLYLKELYANNKYIIDEMLTYVRPRRG